MTICAVVSSQVFVRGHVHELDKAVHRKPQSASFHPYPLSPDLRALDNKDWLQLFPYALAYNFLFSGCSAFGRELCVC